MKRMLVVACALLTLSACSGGEPEVDWSEVPQNQRTQIEDAVSAKDCERMQTYFNGSTNGDVLNYLDWHMDDAGCY